MSPNLEKITPPSELSAVEMGEFFNYFFRRLAQYRNLFGLYAVLECSLGTDDEILLLERQKDFENEINTWAQSLLETAWIVCHGEKTSEECPILDPLSDTAIGKQEHLLSAEVTSRILNTILFLDVTAKERYSSHTRCFLSSLGSLDETAIVSTLRDPKNAIEEVQRRAEATKKEHAQRGKTLRMMGVGLGALAGGVLVGVTGGLAAPLVGAGMATVMSWLGLGGTLVGLVASGLAGSGAVCGALFGAYGAKSTANVVRRFTREVNDLEIVRVHPERRGDDDALSVKLCVSGWLEDPQDVTAPWTQFNGDGIFALQWETEALEELSNALTTLIKLEAMKYVRVEVLKRTVFAGLMSSLAPLALLKIGQIIDNPWMNAKALAIRTGAVLGELLADRAFGHRPVSLAGFSLGANVIFEALKYLSTLPPKHTTHLIQDVLLFGTPVPTDVEVWASIRRLASGRVVNGYSGNDYVLAVLSRASTAAWNIAGLQAIGVKGIENIECSELDGHTMWKEQMRDFEKGSWRHNCRAPSS